MKSRRQKKNEKEVDISIVLSNCKGYGSKEASIKQDILEAKAPDVVLLNETMFRGQKKINPDNYFVYCKNRDEDKKEDKKSKNGGGGGVATLVTSSLRSSSVKVGEGRHGDEYIVTRLGHIQPALNIVNVYGENEKRAGDQRVLETWIRMKGDLDEIKKRGEMISIMGDMNRAVGADKMGREGQQIRDLAGQSADQGAGP